MMIDSLPVGCAACADECDQEVQQGAHGRDRRKREEFQTTQANGTRCNRKIWDVRYRTEHSTHKVFLYVTAKNGCWYLRKKQAFGSLSEGQNANCCFMNYVFRLLDTLEAHPVSSTVLNTMAI